MCQFALPLGQSVLTLLPEKYPLSLVSEPRTCNYSLCIAPEKVTACCLSGPSGGPGHSNHCSDFNTLKSDQILRQMVGLKNSGAPELSSELERNSCSESFCSVSLVHTVQISKCLIRDQ